MFLRDNEIGELLRPHVHPGERVLDYGAGTGLISRWLARRTGVLPTLVDLVDYRNRRRELPFLRQDDPFRLPVLDRSFDVVLLLFVLHHNAYEDQGRVLAEAARVAARRVLVIEDTPASPRERRVNAAWDRLLNLRHGVPTPLAFRGVSEWTDLFPRYGLRPLAARTYRPMWPTMKTYHHTLFVLDATGREEGEEPLDEVARAIRTFVGTELMSRADGSAVTAQTRLLRGVTDSMGIMQLIVFLQEAFGLRFGTDDAIPEHFRTVGDVERLVARKLAGEGAPGPVVA